MKKLLLMAALLSAASLVHAHESPESHTHIDNGEAQVIEAAQPNAVTSEESVEILESAKAVPVDSGEPIQVQEVDPEEKPVEKDKLDDLLAWLSELGNDIGEWKDSLMENDEPTTTEETSDGTSTETVDMAEEPTEASEVTVEVEPTADVKR